MESGAAVRQHIASCSSKSMKTAASRKMLARRLCDLVGYSNLEEMLQFVQEMRGLDFYRSEDRALFCDFFYCWFLEVPHESPNP